MSVLKEFLANMSSESGVSGYETLVADKVLSAFRPFSDDVNTDSLGNVIAKKRYPCDGSTSEGSDERYRVMMAAHMDEIGLIITKIEDGGFLRFSTIGGYDQRTLPGQEVQINTSCGHCIYGIIGFKPPHMTKPVDRRKSVPVTDLYIDIGLLGDGAESPVAVGDIAVIRRGLIEMSSGTVSGKALDDRAGIVAMLATFMNLDKLRWSVEAYAVASVQEEVGVRGATVSSYGVCPHIGIAIDVCHGDMPGAPEDRSHPIGKGPIIELGPHVHPKLFERLKAIADDNCIPYGLEVATSPKGTDAFALQMARDGVPTAVISIPLRYMHTSVETLAVDDIEECGRLLALFIASLDSGFLEDLKCF